MNTHALPIPRLPKLPVDFKQLVLLADVVLLLVLLNTLPFEPAITRGLSLLIFVAILWLTEALHLTITAILIPLLAVILGLMDTTAAMANFANPIIPIFMAGMALSAALNHTGVDRVISERILALAQGRLSTAALMLFGLAALLSGWISNTATTAMMLPLVLGLLSQLDPKKERRTFLFILLGIAYSASLGGIATLVGSPPNAIVSAELGLDFIGWMKLGLPTALILLPIAITLLYFLLRPNLSHHFEPAKQAPILSKTGKQVLLVFAITVLLWIFSRPISSALGGISKFDSLVAILAIIMLCGGRLIEWKEIEKRTDFGILLLFGGGLTLSAVLKASGTSVFLANQLQQLLTNAPLPVILFSIALFVIFLTEISSNTASTALLAPIFAAMAEGLGLPPFVILVLLAVCASCAFMLPVATPPNAIVFSSGLVRQRDMMRAGLFLNLTCTCVLTLLAYLLLR